MQYAMLIYDEDGSRPEPPTEAFKEMMAGYFALSEEVQANGMFQAGAGLQGVDAATTVRVRGGKIATTDGPYAETKEQLGGFYLLECKDLDEAIEYAAKIPTAAFGCIEIRPVMVYDQT